MKVVNNKMNSEIACRSSKTKARRKLSRRPSRSAMPSISLQRSLRKKRMLRALAKEFVAYRVSAAGVSYIVNSRSRPRRWLWFIAVVATISFMAYMTYNVVKEYLGYPKSLIRKDIIQTKLPFPAVTFCSLNPILSQSFEKTSIGRFLKLKRMLRNSTNVQTDTELRDRCYRDSFCQWSWFSETCQCSESPCMTEYCIMVNSSHCLCSFNFCSTEGNRNRTCTPVGLELANPLCFCSNESMYKNWAEKPIQMDDDLLSSLGDPDVEELVDLIREAKTNDLTDVEEAMLPTMDDLMEYGVSFDSLVISCSFEGSVCYRENFTVFYDPRYGKCYMFNFLGTATEAMEKPIDIYNYGSNSGLQLLLHITEQQVVDLLNREIGVRVVVHDPYDLPFVAEYGTNVRPMDMSAVEVTLSSIERLGPPWGSCVKEGQLITFEETPSPYSILGCEKACRHHHLTDRCGCTKRQYLRGSVLLEMKSTNKFCNISNETQFICMEDVIDDIEKGNIKCSCEPPCKETEYSYTVSSSQLNERYFRAVKAIRTLAVNEEGMRFKTNATREKAMVGVKVYYNTFQVEIDTEVASYSWETLVANVGGNLGFFMGLTLVTFVEVLEFLWDILLATFRRSGQLERVNVNRVYASSIKNN